MLPLLGIGEIKWDYEALGWPEDELGSGSGTMFRVFGDVDISEESASLKDQRGKDVPFYLLRETTKGVPLHPIPTIVVLPKKTLMPSTTYSVTLKCKLDGTPFEKTWSFKTAKK